MTEPAYKKLICLDFDGVIHSYTSGWQGAPEAPDPPTPGALNFIRDVLADDTLELTIVSSRMLHPSGKDTIKRYLATHGLTPEEIEQIKMDDRKPPAFVTIDDRAVTFDGVFPSVASLKAFQPWYKKVKNIPAQIHDARHEHIQQMETLDIARIAHCARCDGTHEKVVATRLKGEPSHATHFVMCPATDQPVLVSVEAAHES